MVRYSMISDITRSRRGPGILTSGWIARKTKKTKVKFLLKLHTFDILILIFMKQFITYLNISVFWSRKHDKINYLLNGCQKHRWKYRENHVSKITLQHGFIYNMVAPPGPEKSWCNGGEVYYGNVKHKMWWDSSRLMAWFVETYWLAQEILGWIDFSLLFQWIIHSSEISRPTMSFWWQQWSGSTVEPPLESETGLQIVSHSK